MAYVQNPNGSIFSSVTNYGSCKEYKMKIPDQFPAGLRVLVVDDDMACLRILEKMLQKCSYLVTTCNRATHALSLLRERKGGFDVVISDVHMPDMDGYKLLEHVGLEMDLPVIMMSADGRTSAVMRGVTHGACDYLIKPVRIEELQNIWQHVIRKKWNETKEFENLGSLEENKQQGREIGGDEPEYASSVNEGTDGRNAKTYRKRRDSKEEEDDGEIENDDYSATKKPRVVWSVELHQQFVGAVNQLGIDKAVPKRILELMNIPGLTRENVASHLQKFRLYLKRLSSVHSHGGVHSSLCGSMAVNSKIDVSHGIELQSMAVSRQFPLQTLAALQAELEWPGGDMNLSGLDPEYLLHLSNDKPMEQGHVASDESEMRFSSNTAKLLSEPLADDFTRSSMASNLGAADPSDKRQCINSSGSNAHAQMLPLQPSPLPQSNHAVNMQPSHFVVSSQSSYEFLMGNGDGIPQKGNALASCSHISSQSDSAPLEGGQMLDGTLKDGGILSGFPVPVVPVPFSFPSFLACPDIDSVWHMPSASLNSNANASHRGYGSLPRVNDGMCCYSGKAVGFTHHGAGNNPIRVSKGMNISSHFAADVLHSSLIGQMGNKASANAYDAILGRPVFNMDIAGSREAGLSGLRLCPPNDLLSIISK